MSTHVLVNDALITFCRLSNCRYIVSYRLARIQLLTGDETGASCCNCDMPYAHGNNAD